MSNHRGLRVLAGELSYVYRIAIVVPFGRLIGLLFTNGYKLEFTSFN